MCVCGIPKFVPCQVEPFNFGVLEDQHRLEVNRPGEETGDLQKLSARAWTGQAAA